MELILISDSKLKIMLTHEDMRRYELDTKSCRGDDRETRKAFRSILDEVKHQTGFDAASDRVFIQMYPSKEGGCELFVTKLGLLCPDREADDRPTRHAYVFGRLEDLLSVCRRLRQTDWQGESAAWRDGSGRYYLWLTHTAVSPHAPLSPYAFISEYGSEEDADRLRLYIDEYGHPIKVGDAVALLGTL